MHEIGALLSMQASQTPNKDLSAREIAAAERFSEHLLFLQRQQRAFLSILGHAHRRLLGLALLISSFADVDSVPDQVWHNLSSGQAHGSDGLGWSLPLLPYMLGLDLNCLGTDTVLLPADVCNCTAGSLQGVAENF